MAKRMETIPCEACLSRNPCTNTFVKGLTFTDRHGDRWIRQSCFTLRRVHDGNIGLWNNGNGLTYQSKTIPNKGIKS